ncbi:MAG: phage tail tape measure protein [Flavobacteriaceae bacterium]|nr:phage tail tape measure protein [Flavobacteriaceae bacterium]
MASKAIGFLNFKFAADLKPFDRAMKKASKKLKKFGRSVTRTGQTLTRNLTLPILALGAASIKAFDEQAKAETKLLTALNGRIDVQGRLIEQAKELQKTTLFGDEATIEAQSLLAMFGLSEEQIKMLIPLIQDMSTGLNMDLVGATSLVAKSVATSTDALKRYFETGLDPTMTRQEKTIALTESLTEAFGGQANAAALVGAGALVQLKNQLGDVGEEIGGKLMPFVKKLVDWLKKMIEKFDNLSPQQKDNIVKWGLIIAAIGPVLIIFGKLAIGVGGLITAFKVLSTFLITNPYIALAAVLVALSVAIYKVVGGLTAQYNSQKNINDLNKQAGNRIIDDITNIQLLTATIEDENTTLADKKIALTTLKKLYPGYYDEVDEATFSQDTMAESTKKLTHQLLGMSKLEVFEERLREINRELYELSKSTGEAGQGTKITVQTALTAINPLVGVTVGLWDQLTGVISNPIQIKTESKKITALNEESKDLVETILGLKEEFKTITPTKTEHGITTIIEEGDGDGGAGKTPWEALGLPAIKEIENFFKEVNNIEKQNLLDGIITQEDFDKRAKKDKVFQLEQLKQIYEEYGQSTLDIDGKILDAKIALYEKEEEIVTKATNAQLLLNEGVELFGDILGSSLNSAIDNQENFFKVFLDNIKKTIRQLLIQLAIMTMIDVLLGSKNLSKALLQGNAMKILGLQEGGIVSGPTTALIGEGAGTSISNPEVVAPLDKLKQYMGGSQNVNVTGRLVGNDIFLSNARTKFNRKRTV